MEWSLKLLEIDMWWMWCWINVFEAIVSLPLAFGQIALMPEEAVSGRAPSDLMADGYAALARGDVLPLWLLFIFSIVITKGFIGLTLYYDSATLMWRAAAAAIPLSDILFYVLPGFEQSTSPAVELGGLAIVTAGVVLYNWKNLKR